MFLMLTWMILWNFIKCLPAHPIMMLKTDFDYKEINFKIFDKKYFFGRLLIFNLLQRTPSLESQARPFCHHYMKYIFHCADKIILHLMTPPHSPIPSSNSHTTTFRTRDSSNDSGNWCEHDSFWETRREIILFLCFCT